MTDLNENEDNQSNMKTPVKENNKDKDKDTINIQSETYQGTIKLEKKQTTFTTGLNYENEDLYTGYASLEGNTFTREGFGQYTYKNGSQYLGQWNMNKKHGKGLFYYSSGDVYYGDWENNLRKGTGIYFWENPSSDPTSSSAYFQVYIGEFSHNQLVKGLMLYDKPKENEKPEETNHYLYIGEFNKLGEKDDQNGIMYDLKRNFFFIGRFVKEIIKDAGHQISFDEKKDEVDNMFSVSIKENENQKGKIEEIWQFPIDIRNKTLEKLSEEEIDKEKDRVVKMYMTYIGNDKIADTFMKLYQMVMKCKGLFEHVSEEDKENGACAGKLNEMMKEIEGYYPEWNLLLSMKDNDIKKKEGQSGIKENEEENENDISLTTNTATVTGAALLE